MAVDDKSPPAATGAGGVALGNQSLRSGITKVLMDGTLRPTTGERCLGGSGIAALQMHDGLSLIQTPLGNPVIWLTDHSKPVWCASDRAKAWLYRPARPAPPQVLTIARRGRKKARRHTRPVAVRPRINLARGVRPAAAGAWRCSRGCLRGGRERAGPGRTRRPDGAPPPGWR
jgi:hypothetical protein